MNLEPMKVQNPTQALELLAKDAGALQSYRELTHNAIQAIQAMADGTGSVTWDVDWISVELAIKSGDTPVYRLACFDDGEGMTAHDQQTYINQLFVSGRDQATDKNFGIGAKVTAGAKNPAGVEYRSWKDDVGSRIVFERDELGNYGLRRFEVGGKVEPSSPLGPSAKPQEIGHHGTVVVLHGAAGDEDTIGAPPGTIGGMKWLARYLNQRYFSFPSGIKVRARELPADRGNWPTTKPSAETSAGSMRTVTGMRSWLDKNSALDDHGRQQLGTVSLADGARVHWWILNPDATSDVHWSRGHSAALFQDEIYDALEANPHRIRLQAFGVIFSSRQVAVYVEPSGDVTATMARDSLRLGGDPLPWEAWGRSFREDVPAAIVELERSVREQASSTDHSRSIRDRLRQYEDLFKITAWRPAEDGTETAWGESPSGAGNKRSPEGRAKHNGSDGAGAHPQSGGTRKRDYLAGLDDDGVPAERITPGRDIPKVEWVSFSTTSQPPDRAAEYVRDQNTIYANSDFRVFTDMSVRLADEYVGAPEELHESIVSVVEEWYGQVLVESVLRSWNFEHERAWQDADYEKLVSPEALTMAVLPFTFMFAKLKQAIHTRIGRPPTGI